MEKPLKRRVLSLSLSQPSKQQRKLKQKRHVSANSDKDGDGTSSVKRDGSNSPPKTSYNEPTRNGALRRNSSEEREVPTVALDSKVPGSEDFKLPTCFGPKEDTCFSSVIECLSSEFENGGVHEDDKCSTESKLTDNSSPKKTTAIAQSLMTIPDADANLSDMAAQESKTDIDCRSLTADIDIEVLQCPLCHKTFEKLLSKTTHLKSCASKRKLPTHQLIEILELQKRQAAERRALGLPDVHPAPAVIKKTMPLRKENRKAPKVDSNLQLAMALSLSMQDMQSIGNMKSTESAREISLDCFGFTSKSVLESAQIKPNITSSRGKGNINSKIKPTLLTRTSEERQQIITEKVAMVLLEETQANERDNIEAINLKSAFLQELHNKENMLWSKAYTSPSKNDRASYYVQSLQGFISPSKVEIGSKVMHLSQVAGRVKTPPREIKQKEDGEVVCTSHTEEDSSSDPSSPQIEIKNATHIEMKLRAKLFNDWAGMVNNTIMSDLMIYPQEGREIPTHKLILSVRCPRILKDISKQCNSLTGNQVEVIMWSKTPHAAALAFLEYVYCGSVKSIRVLSGDLSSVTWLATHYRISDLSQYLYALKEETVSQTSSQVALNVIRSMDQSSNASFNFEDSRLNCKESQQNEINSTSLVNNEGGKPSCVRRLSKPLLNLISAPSRASSRSETDSIYSEATVQESDVRSLCSSPDLFGDDEAEESPEEGVSGEVNLLLTNDLQSKCLSTNKPPLKTDLGVSDRPLSATSISSEKTVVCENLSSPPNSRGSSIASANTEILEKDTLSASPPSSMACADTKVSLSCGYNSKKLSLLSNESKRKLSNSSQDGEKSASKRLCPYASVKDSNAENTDSQVDFFDLTQDSDSSVSPSNTKKSKSLDSCEKVSISSDSEPQYHKARKEQTTPKQSEDVTIETSLGLTTEGTNESPELIEPVGDAYVSPVWDGFEDLNYDDQFVFSPQPIDMDNQHETSTVSTMLSDNKNQSNNSAVKPVFEPIECKDLENNCQSDSEISPKNSKGNSNPSTSTGFDALLDDSLNVNDTLLQQAECGKLTQRDTRGTPVNRILSSLKDTDVTPLANYSAMKTPELKRELQKFGLKPTLGKRKGKIMLRHIYNELHPWVPETSGARFQAEHGARELVDTQGVSQSNSKKLVFSGCGRNNEEGVPLEDQDTNSDSDSASDIERESSVNTSLQEIKFMEDDCEEVPLCSQAFQSASKNLPNVVRDFIINDSKLHQQLLEYEPIWIEKLHTDLRNNGYKYKMEDIMSFLDEKCITFRTSSSGSRVKKRKQNSIPTKKKILDSGEKSS